MEMQLVAWIASGLVFLNFFMKTLVMLRLSAIFSNIAFIAYGLLGLHYQISDKVLPILVLHASLLPLNILRLREIRRTFDRGNTGSGKAQNAPNLQRSRLHPPSLAVEAAVKVPPVNGQKKT